MISSDLSLIITFNDILFYKVIAMDYEIINGLNQWSMRT